MRNVLLAFVFSGLSVLPAQAQSIEFSQAKFHTGDNMEGSQHQRQRLEDHRCNTQLGPSGCVVQQQLCLVSRTLRYAKEDAGRERHTRERALRTGTD